MKGKIAVALTAAFGGISPHLLKIAICLAGEERRDPGVNSGYLVGLLLFAVLGGAVALIWGETDLRKAFYLGIGLPAMLQIASSGVRHNKTSQIQNEEFSLFATAAYAAPLQSTERDNAASVVLAGSEPSYRLNRALALNLDDVPAGTELVFKSSDGSLTYKKPVPASDENGRVTFQIPDFATDMSLRTKDLESNNFKLKQSSGATTKYNVDIDSDFWGGFLRSLGVEGAESYKFEIEPVPQ